MKKMKSFLAILLSLVMAGSGAMVAFAEEISEETAAAECMEAVDAADFCEVFAAEAEEATDTKTSAGAFEGVKGADLLGAAKEGLSTMSPGYRSEKKKIADNLYEVEYHYWNENKAEILAYLISKEHLIRNFEDWQIDSELVTELGKLKKHYEEQNVWEPMLAAVGGVMCTSCRTGNLIGRNFDWAAMDADEYVVRVEPDLFNNVEHASIGVASEFFPKALQPYLYGMDDMLPMLTMDGVNDANVAANVNVVNVNDDKVGTTGTNPEKKDLCAGFAVREILDHADTARDGVEILLNRNIFSVYTQEFHWMISDPDETYIVECVENTPVVLRKENKAAMSNFHVTNSEKLAEPDDEGNIYFVCKTEEDEDGTVHVTDEPLGESPLVGNEYFDYPMGIERYERAITGLDDVTTKQEMLEHMKPQWFRFYYYEGYEEQFWSDKNKTAYEWDEDGFPTKKLKYTDTSEELVQKRLDFFKKDQQKYAEEKALEKKTGKKRVNNGIAQTVHSCAYDLSDLTFSVYYQEREVPFTFALEDELFENTTPLYINGDNVGPAVKCSVPGAEWVYDQESNTVTLLGSASYQIEGEKESGITVKKTSPDPTPVYYGGTSETPLFTGTMENPVTGGNWSLNAATGIWTFATSRTFKNTWGCIVNPYAAEGQHKADWFRFGADGSMLTGWQLVDGKWYYLNPAHDGTYGACLLGPAWTPDGYEVDASGAWTGNKR